MEVSAMSHIVTRRALLQLTALAPVLPPVFAQTGAAANSVVALVKGESRRKNVAAALAAIDEQIGPSLKTRKSVLIKTNFVSTFNQLASTHADAVHGVLDYLEPRFRGPVVIAESSAGDTMEAFETFHYPRLAAERHVQLVDLNREGRFHMVPLLDADLHAAPARLAARVFDPDAFVICVAIPKTHDTVVATLSVKNMGMGAPLHSAPGVTPSWNDKRIAHNGLRQTHYNIFLGAQAMRPNWGAAVIDGFEGMEGAGPNSGTAVPSRIAIASTDFIAADRVALETMGIDAAWVGYLRYCGDCGIGQYDLTKITLRGESIATVRRKYRLHPNIERELQWMGRAGQAAAAG
jgi:uncharacterized protein (DUF362 family)